MTATVGLVLVVRVAQVTQPVNHRRHLLLARLYEHLLIQPVIGRKSFQILLNHVREKSEFFLVIFGFKIAEKR